MKTINIIIENYFKLSKKTGIVELRNKKTILIDDVKETSGIFENDISFGLFSYIRRFIKKEQSRVEIKGHIIRKQHLRI